MRQSAREFECISLAAFYISEYLDSTTVEENVNAFRLKVRKLLFQNRLMDSRFNFFFNISYFKLFSQIFYP